MHTSSFQFVPYVILGCLLQDESLYSSNTTIIGWVWYKVNFRQATEDLNSDISFYYTNVK